MTIEVDKNSNYYTGMKGYYVTRKLILPVSVWCQGEAERSHVENLSSEEFTNYWTMHADNEDQSSLLWEVDLVQVGSQEVEVVDL